MGKHSTDYKNAITSIQERLNRAHQIKGNLTLNNANDYGNSWKTPALDMKFKQLHGGATAQRFYSKFPIYRERNQPPDVHDNIADVWRQTIDLTPQQKPVSFPAFETRNKNELKSYLKKRHESMNVTQNKFGIPKDLTAKNLDNDDKKSTRSKSIMSSKIQLKDEKQRNKTLKLLGGQTITLPMRERFNEEVESAIHESNHRSTGLNHKTLAGMSKERLGALTCESSKSKLTASRVTGTSKKTKTAQELQLFFKQNEEDIKSKYSRISSKSKNKISFKDKLYVKLGHKTATENNTACERSRSELKEYADIDNKNYEEEE